jgi:Flp pilus assembly protein TadD
MGGAEGVRISWEPIMAPTLLLALLFAVLPDENPLQVNDDIKQCLAEHIDRRTQPLEKLETLVRTVFQENALHFTYQLETRTAAETFAKRGGNCVSFTFLLIAMARQLGLDARFREVEVAPMWSRVGNLVTMSGHVNVAVLLGGQPYIVDLFPQVTRIEIGGTIVSDGRALAHYYNNRGVDHLVAGRMDDALAYFSRAVQCAPTMARSWGNLGVAQSRTGRYADAEASYRRVLQLQPGNQVTMGNLAVLYRQTGRERDAQRFEAKAKKLQLKNPYYHFDLGMRAYESADYSGAIEHFKAALKLKPVEHNFDMAMARAYMQLGDRERVANYLQLAAKNAPTDAARLRYNEKLALLNK